LHFLDGITVAGVVNGGWTPIWRKFLTVACQPHPTAAQLSSLERRALEAIKLHLSLRLCEIAPNGFHPQAILLKEAESPAAILAARSSR
jgi:hypothetical protein